ncbi:NADPH:quinone reductase [Actinoplanes sp. SE50]|uniref:NADPH:quinone reductase n=1 Tax=unclassified Actinoplanes TaxID=2626549 RepID=UPI00023EC8B5|nr:MULTISPECIES: NADPH:quinone reductase [unclassified Actinoplanes]AEV81478.1 NADPH2:quinone reductase [Actinoplanes sp. SE50/110]ATO79881.1 NADPH:quinone reductase [Actinoplanes sp. SE50]SLL97283.1 NADPH:quinone reductase [Actinoplanes sp. SE50/110]
MRAAVFAEPGPASAVLHLVERELPLAGADEVRVRIVLSAVNPTDVGTRAGRGVPDGVRPPRVPNQDGAGVVDALGEGVTDLEPGDRVWVWDAGYGRADGTAQEYVVLPRRQVVRMNDDIPFEVGADLGIPALTAHRCLTVASDGPARLGPGALEGRTVLVAGGAGAVGNAAIQLAKWSGATVLTTVSSKEKGALAAAAGADAVIDYREEDVAARIRELSGTGPHLIVEVDTANLTLDLDVIAPGGNIAIYVAGEVRVPFFTANLKNASLDFVLTYTTLPEEKANAVAAVAEAANAGVFRVGEEHGLPIIRFPLDGVAAAHEAVENHAVGKVVIDVTQP